MSIPMFFSAPTTLSLITTIIIVAVNSGLRLRLRKGWVLRMHGELSAVNLGSGDVHVIPLNCKT
jgi:hypothetical protein